MAVVLIGANPMATLTQEDRRTAIVSIWEVDWSVHGPGRAVFAWREGDPAVRLLASDARLGVWLGETFTAHFPEFAGLPAIADPVEGRFTHWRIETERARIEAVGADGSRIAASIGAPVAARPAHVPNFPLAEPGWTLTNLLAFCAEARLDLDGEPAEGDTHVTHDGSRSRSTAFIATHETWTRHTAEPDRTG